jgi:hypothetical protein
MARRADKVVFRMQKMKLWSAFAKLDQTMRTLQSRSSFEGQLEDDICSTLSIERERVTILCHQKGSVLSEIVFGKPDTRQVTAVC